MWYTTSETIQTQKKSTNWCKVTFINSRKLQLQINCRNKVHKSCQKCGFWHWEEAALSLLSQNSAFYLYLKVALRIDVKTTNWTSWSWNIGARCAFILLTNERQTRWKAKFNWLLTRCCINLSKCSPCPHMSSMFSMYPPSTRKTSRHILKAAFLNKLQ